MSRRVTPVSDDIDDRYRRESASDPSRPSDSVRQAVLAHAARVAAGSRKSREMRNRRRGVFGLLAAAALAGLLVIPRFSKPPGPAMVRVYAPESAAAPEAAAERAAGPAPAGSVAAAPTPTPTPTPTTADAPESPVPAPPRAHSLALDQVLAKSHAAASAPDAEKYSVSPNQGLANSHAAESLAAMRAQSAVAPPEPAPGPPPAAGTYSVAPKSSVGEVSCVRVTAGGDGRSCGSDRSGTGATGGGGIG